MPIRRQENGLFHAGPARRNQDRKAVFQCESPITAAAPPFPQPAGTLITFHLAQKHGGASGDNQANKNLGRFRLSVTTTPGAEADPLPARVRQIVEVGRDRRSPAEEVAVFHYWRTTVAEWKAAKGEPPKSA